MTSPQKPATLEIAEIRVHVHNFSSSYPVRVRGLRHIEHIFHRSGKTGQMTRRYIAGKNDPQNGIYPLEQAAADMEDIQTGVLGHFQLVWKFITLAEFEASEAADKADIELREQQEKEARKERDRLQAIAAEATTELQRLSEPGAVVNKPTEPDAPTDKAEDAPKPAPKAAPKKGQRPAVLDKIAGGAPAPEAK